MMRRKVALKLLTVSTNDDRQLRHFERESRCASLLNHPNVVTVYEVGEDEGVRYIATELVDGETLRQRLERGPMTIVAAVDVAIGVASALVAAHEAWLVHRDIKPENIAIRKDGGVKVLDFGVSAITADHDSTDPIRRPGALVGTLHYLSPEQVRGEPIIDTRSDIYSLGVVLYEMLAGHVPFGGPGIMDVLAAIVEKDPAPLSPLVPATLRALVESCLRKDMYRRPQTAAEIVAVLMDVRLDLAMIERAAQA